ncbi:unnamed protein product [Amoebophrya sp. A25]|nr:unnamed protein product [Amoebophrya sp. A25]|eukprot:GSA25T00004813001.1
MCGRCAAIAEKGCVEKIAGTKKWRRNGDKVSTKYNLSPYDKSVCVPVIHAAEASTEKKSIASASGTSAMGVAPSTTSTTSASIVPPAVETDSSFSLSGMRWGMVPSFAKEEKQQFTFNSRIETLDSSPMWKRCLKVSNRCIIVVQGFYEWGKQKKPRLVQMAKGYQGFSLAASEEDGQQDHKNAGAQRGTTETFKEVNKGRNFPMLMCGIYDRWAGPGYSEPLESTSIITMATPKESGLASIHDRIPLLLLDADSARQWLSDGTTPIKQLLNKLETNSHKARLDIFEVDKKVGNARNESADCITPLADYQKQQYMKNFGRFLVKKEPAANVKKEEAKGQQASVEETKTTTAASGSTTSSTTTTGSSAAGSSIENKQVEEEPAMKRQKIDEQ